MAADDKLTERIKKIIRQISGKLSDTDVETELIPEYRVKGSGILYCLGVDYRKFTKVARGISVYVIAKNFDTQRRTLVYTICGDIVLMEPEEIEEIGFE
mgnify:CR=1 FL=1|tara:strand:+ start:204 stop:500 length:297 start_codon:yes stop_codon:yes gene_type:complete